MQRTWAIVERELRRFRRSPMLIVMSMIFPIVQLVVLGYAFGGNVKHLKLAIVDQDHGVPAVKVRELAAAVASGARTFDTIDYADPGQALDRPAQRARQRRADDSAGLLAAGAGARTSRGSRSSRTTPTTSSRRRSPATLGGAASRLQPAGDGAARSPAQPTLDVVEVYPYVPYIQYLLPGSIVMSIFMMVMIGGGIIFIDDKARGLHEGYLVTPITKLELIAGFNISGTIKAVLAGAFLMIIGSLIAGIPEPVRSDAAAPAVRGHRRDGVRADQHDVPADGARHRSAAAARDVRRAEHAALLPERRRVSAAGISRAGCRSIAVVDPFTYAVHAFKSLLLKNTGFEAIAYDLAFLLDVLRRRDDAPRRMLFRRTL